MKTPIEKVRSEYEAGWSEIDALRKELGWPGVIRDAAMPPRCRELRQIQLIEIAELRREVEVRKSIDAGLTI